MSRPQGARRRDRDRRRIGALLSEARQADELRTALLDLEDAATLNASGSMEAAVLVPIFGWPNKPGLVFTERRADLRRHAGEISFPGGRRDDGDESFTVTALREAEEEIGLPPSKVDVLGGLPPFGTFVTNYAVHPVVGLIPSDFDFTPNPTEVETILAFTVEALRESFAMRRLVRRGLPIRTPTYELDGHMIWGATARILGELLERMKSLET